MVSNWLLRISVSLLLVGLLFGIVMAARQDFALAPAHAHLNLVGFVLMFAAGLYYRLVPAAAQGLLAKVQATLHVVGAIVFPAGIAMVLSWGPGYEAVAVVGALIILVAMTLFAVIVFRTTASERATLRPMAPRQV